MDDVRTAVREFILANYLAGESDANLRDDTRLLSSGILDSMASLELVAFLEQRFAVDITAFERGIEQLDRIQDIVNLLSKKLAESKA